MFENKVFHASLPTTVSNFGNHMRCSHYTTTPVGVSPKWQFEGNRQLASKSPFAGVHKKINMNHCQMHIVFTQIRRMRQLQIRKMVLSIHSFNINAMQLNT